MDGNESERRRHGGDATRIAHASSVRSCGWLELSRGVSSANDRQAGHGPIEPFAFAKHRRLQRPPTRGAASGGEWKLGLVWQPFSPLEARSYDHEMETDRDGVAAYYSSTSSTAQLPPAERAELRAELVDALADVRYRLLLTAHVHTARRLPFG